jgi:multiple sugar transport system substrate-binding protein
MKGCKYPQQAAEFAVWLNSNPTSVSMLTEDGAGWPAAADLSQVSAINNSPSVFKYYGGENINNIFAAADKQVDQKATSVPTASQVYDDLTNLLTTSPNVNGVLNQVQNQTVAKLKAKGLSVATG